MKLQNTLFQSFSELQTGNLRRGAWGAAVFVVLLNLLIGQPSVWPWIGAFVALTAGLIWLSRHSGAISAGLHFVSVLVVIALIVNRPSGFASHADPALAFSTISIPIIMSASAFLGGFGTLLAVISGLGLAALLKSPTYLPFAGIQIVAVAIFSTSVNNIIRQLEQTKTALEKAAMVDVLTSLENRRALETSFERYTALAARQGVPLLMTSWDLNDLKNVNDARGHAAGDAYLRAFADALRAELRGEDACFRVGGDEFVGLHLSLEDGSALIERVRARFPNVAAGWTVVANDLDVALHQSDKMMYAHKAILKSASSGLAYRITA